MTYPPLNKVTVWCDTGETWTTNVSAQTGEQEAVDYFLGEHFNIGLSGEDYIVFVDRVIWEQGKP